MSDKPTILLQLDTDPLPSVFDRVVAVDAGVQHVFSYGGVTPQNVMPLVHGCIFTRGPKDLHRTAIFVGGSDVAAGEAVLAEVKKHLIPQYGLSVSLMLDSNGANTTAAAAVRAAGRHLDLSSAKSLVLGGDRAGRAAGRAAAGEARRARPRRFAAEGQGRGGVRGRPGARSRTRSSKPSASARRPTARPRSTAARWSSRPGRRASYCFPKKVRDTGEDAEGRHRPERRSARRASRAWSSTTRATDRDGVVCYGALGVGGTKMKIHKAAIAKLFEANNAVLDVEEIYNLALQLQ